VKKPSSASDDEDGEISGFHQMGNAQRVNSAEKANNKIGRSHFVP
jgi:hypothetical protein